MQPAAAPEMYSEQPAPLVEAAILFSAGRDAAAIQVLEAEIARPASAEEAKAWAMLLEIHYVRKDRPAFEAVADRYAEKAGGTVPCWSTRERYVSVPGMFCLEGVVACSKDLAALVQYSRTRKMVGIDMGGVERIRFEFATELCALLRLYSYQGKHIILGNIRETHAQLLEVVGGISQIVLLRSRPGDQPCLAVLQAA